MDIGMLFYIFLFAVSQDPHRQGAWAKAFAVWLVVEIIIISSVVVFVMQVLIPSIVMKDVSKIRKRLLDSLQQYHHKMISDEQKKLEYNVREQKGDDSSSSSSSEDENDSKEVFNAAKYLFTSYKLANRFPEVKVAKIIQAFQTPWPKQSFNHSVDVSKQYNRKLDGINRPISIVLMFFLTSLISVPMDIQDLCIQMATTAIAGYTFLIHVQLYKIYPVLIIVPTLILAALIHFFILSGRINSRLELSKLFKSVPPLPLPVVAVSDNNNNNNDRKKEDNTFEVASRKEREESDIEKEEDESEEYEIGEKGQKDKVLGIDGETSINVDFLPFPTYLNKKPPFVHQSRKQSVQHGIEVARIVQATVNSELVSSSLNLKKESTSSSKIGGGGNSTSAYDSSVSDDNFVYIENELNSFEEENLYGYKYDNCGGSLDNHNQYVNNYDDQYNLSGNNSVSDNIVLSISNEDNVSGSIELSDD
jgi:hypothetical protein